MKKKKSFNLIDLTFIGVALILFAIWGFSFVNSVETKALKERQANTNINIPDNSETNKKESQNIDIKKEEVIENTDQQLEFITERNVINNISKFDLSFLKLENQKNNKVYSPLSLKYALKMLEEGAINTSRWKITQAIGNRALTKYTSNDNMSFANAFFIKESYKDIINENYINDLENKHNAEIIFDSFEKAEPINSWVKDKTFKLIDNLIDEENLKSDILLINALAIDMEWENKFLESITYSIAYSHENFGWGAENVLRPLEFGQNQNKVSSMEVLASINNYDIVSTLGEENIKNTVYEAFLKFCEENPDNFISEEGDLAPEKRNDTFNKFFYGGYSKTYYDNQENLFKYEGYLSELNSNYGDVSFNTDFMLHVDDSIKVFAKDLKEYDGTTLQYIGIMPINEELDSYINNIDEKKINNIIANLKDLNCTNFKDGVITKIVGHIPKFKFEYDLNLKEDLKKLGLGHIFEKDEAGLEYISEKQKLYIYDAIHKSVIEFTQDGIKAAAATDYGGGAGGDAFDYIYEVPVEEIDITFDKPYMFLIRDKKTGELWFAGTVYEPFSWTEEDPMYTGAY